MKTYLVTGAAGFIGSFIAKKMLENGDKVITIDNLRTGKREVIPDGVVFLEGNDYDENIIKQLDQFKLDAIVHIAGQSSGAISFDDPMYDLNSNVTSTLLLLDYAVKHSIKSFVYASSMAAYGDIPDEELPVKETSKSTPKSFYGVGKMASENYMRIYSNQFGIKCTALRFFNVFGAGQNLDNLRQGMASIFLALALNDHHIKVLGSLDRYRDQIYVDDVVNAVTGSIDRKKGDLFEMYNVCNTRKVYVRELIEYIENHLPFEVTHEYVGETPGDQMGIYGDNAKLKRDLDWDTTITFEEGMDKMIEWALRERNIKK
ncbi:MAG: NAD-dependent epimerase/dehydratase family protein [Bacteroidaceae bacterium]|nr:NAD-dependent epimerase/dehydratase family protein [Bacteroidaceae bacterium]